jgi:two-component system, OmpR family, phosphate regulon response regulator PhoB
MRRLLIADDEEGVRTLVRITLEDESIEILEAADGDEALDLAKRLRPELVLLDVEMPGRSGYEVCRALKDDAATAGITVVMLTARARAADMERGLEAGADDYFTKPFSPVALMQMVEQVLGNGGAG